MNSDPARERGLLLAGALTVVMASLLGNPGITGPTPGWLLAGAGVLAVFVGWVCERRGLRSGNYYGLVLSVSFLFWCSLASLDSWAPYLSKLSLMALCGSVAVLCAFHLGISQRGQWRMCAHTMVAGATLNSLYALTQYFSEGDLVRLQSNFTNPDTFAVVPFLGLCLLGALLGRAQKLELVWLVLSATILLPALLLTQSRSALLGLWLALVLVAILGWKSPRGTALRRSLGFTLWSLVPACAFLAASTLWLPSLARWGRLLESDFDLAIRGEMLVGSVQCGFSRPIMGSGPGTFPLAYQEVRPLSTPSTEYVNVAHNDFAQALVETGMIGMMLWAGLLGLAAAAGWNGLKQVGWRSESAWSLAALAGLLAYSQFNFATPVVTTQIWWYALLGLLFALPRGAGDPRQLPPLARFFLSGLIIIAGLVSLGYGLRVEMARRAFTKARLHQERLDWRQSYQELGRAIEMLPDNPEFRLERARLAQELSLLLQDPDYLRQAEYDLERALESNSRNLLALFDAYHFYLEQSQPERAREMLEQALAAAPYEPGLSRYLAGHQLLNSQLKAAAHTLARAGSYSELPPLLVRLEESQEGTALELLDSLPSEQAIPLAERACQICVQEGRARCMDVFYGWLSQHHKEPEFRLEWALSLKSAGATQRCQQILGEIVKQGSLQNPAHEQALVELSSTEGASGVTRLQAALNDNPGLTRVRVALSRHQPVEEALPLLSQGLEIHPSDPELLAGMGDLYAREGLNEIALDYYLQARRRFEEHPELDQKIKGMEKS